MASSDATTVKKARTAYKSKVTRTKNRIDSVLKIDSDSKFIHDDINYGEVMKLFDELKKSFEAVQELHDKYQMLREEGTTQTDEDQIIEVEDKYMEDLSNAYYDTMAKVNRYEKSYQIHDAVIKLQNKIPAKKFSLKEAKEAFDVKQQRAADVLSSSDEAVLLTASIVRDELKEASDKLFIVSGQLRELLNGKVDATNDEKELADVSKERIRINELFGRLDQIIKKQESTKKATETPVAAKTNSNSIKLNKPDPIKFTGYSRDFATFKRNFEAIVIPAAGDPANVGLHLIQALPEKHRHLVSNIDISDHKKMMDVLMKEFGTSRLVIDSVTAEIERLKNVTSDKMFLEFVEKLEKIERDLKTMNLVGEVANNAVLSKLEVKLPTVIHTKWAERVVKDKLDEKTSMEKFTIFMQFLDESKSMVKFLTSEAKTSSGAGKVHAQTCYVTGQTYTVKPSLTKEKANKDNEGERTFLPCLACNVDGATNLEAATHSMDSCAVWNGFAMKDKVERVKCIKHPFTKKHITTDCPVQKHQLRKCKICSEKTHHYLLCPKKTAKTITKASKTKSMIDNGEHTSITFGDQTLLPVMLQTGYVKGAHKKALYGAMFDLCSTDDYVTHESAKKFKYPEIDVELVIEGIKAQEYIEKSKLYLVPVVDKYGNKYELPCYGLEKISSAAEPPEKESYEMLCNKFSIKPSQVKRPEKIDLLISMRSNFLHPERKSRIGGMTLYEGPLGMVFGGSDSDLRFTPHVNSYPTAVREVVKDTFVHLQTMKTIVKAATLISSAKNEKEFLDYFKEENIGAECNPRCGGCRCGQCASGSKSMSLKNEREYDKFRANMYLDKEGTPNDPGPYWRTKYPWNIDKNELPQNFPAVLGVMNSTVRKLDRDPNWKQVYEQQLKDLVKNGFAEEVSEEKLRTWKNSGGKTYYIAHQMALNPGSKSTPVRVVFNSSQMFRGHSLNSSWDLGPGIINNMHGILLRLRKDKVAAQGDVKKMYYMVRVTEEEEMMQLFVWKFTGEENLRTFCMKRLVMGNKPSGNISIIAMHETASLQNFQVTHPVAFNALKNDSYVDNVLITAPDLEAIESGIKEIEFVAKQGGFYFKEWVISGHDVPLQVISVQLPNAISPDEEKALGLHWDVKNDMLFIKVDLTAPSKKGKGAVVSIQPNVREDQCQTPFLVDIKPALTLRSCLSLHAKTYDPLGLFLPVKMVGNLLFRKTLQTLKKER